MGPTIKLEFSEKVAKRYKNAKSHEKPKILDEFCATFDYSRKYAIRKLNTLIKRRRPRPPKQEPGPKSKYNLPRVTSIVGQRLSVRVTFYLGATGCR